MNFINKLTPTKKQTNVNVFLIKIFPFIFDKCAPKYPPAKEPIINNISSNNYTQDEINENIDEVPLNQKTKYFSPSLEILETDNASAKKRLDKENIKPIQIY